MSSTPAEKAVQNENYYIAKPPELYAEQKKTEYNEQTKNTSTTICKKSDSKFPNYQIV